MNSPVILEIEHLEVRYGDACALADVSLRVRSGEIVSVIGGNGAGKTTLIRSIAGMVCPVAGTIRFGGADILGLSADRVTELGIGQVPEGRQIFGSMSVRENLEIGAFAKRARAGRQAMRDKVYQLFPRLAERRAQEAGTLSGGEQQMLAIGRCLMTNPALIMFDEPSLGLAPTIVHHLFNVMRELRQTGITILLVEQNVAESLELCDRAYLIENGETVLAGTGTELANNDRIREAYLGI